MAPSAAADQPKKLSQTDVVTTQQQAPPAAVPPAAFTLPPQPQQPHPWSTPLGSLLLPGAQRAVGPLLPSAEAKSSRLDPQQEVALLRFFSVQDKVSRTEAEVLAKQVCHRCLLPCLQNCRDHMGCLMLEPAGQGLSIARRRCLPSRRVPCLRHTPLCEDCRRLSKMPAVLALVLPCQPHPLDV